MVNIVSTLSTVIFEDSGIFRVNLGDLSILLGTYNRRDFRGIRRSLNEVIIHHSFTSDKAHDTNDIALLSLNRPVKITGNILPICLPHPSKLPIPLAINYRNSNYIKPNLLKLWLCLLYYTLNEKRAKCGFIKI